MIARLAIGAVLFVTLLVVPLFAHSQIVCTQLGAFTDCAGPGIDQTQVRTGSNTGIIITDRDTMPYTVLTPSRSTFDPPPVVDEPDEKPEPRSKRN